MSFNLTLDASELESNMRGKNKYSYIRSTVSGTEKNLF